MKPITLHHSSIRVSDVARSVEFYEGLLGLRSIPRPDFGIPVPPGVALAAPSGSASLPAR